MSDDGGSITRALRAWKGGDRDSVRRLWEAYFHRLVVLARGRLDRAARLAADEEDVALSAFASFCRRAERGEFPRLDDRDDLWRLLFVITTRKAINLARHERREKRGGGRVVNDATPTGVNDSSAVEGPIHQVVGSEPTPEFAALMAEECGRLLDRLPDGEHRQIAIWKMEGYTNTEIAAKLDAKGVKGYEMSYWNAAYVPAKTPEAIVKRLNELFIHAMGKESVKSFVERGGMEVFTNTPLPVCYSYTQQAAQSDTNSHKRYRGMSDEFTPQTDPDQPVVYQIRIKGHLSSQWTEWFEGLAVTLEADGNTRIAGPVEDQAALHGLLKKIRDLGMELISVNRNQFNETHRVCKENE